MVLVAISALAVGPGYRYLRVLWLRSKDYEASAKLMRGEAAADSRLATIVSGRPDAAKAAKRSAAWHAERAVVYERASWRPWITVPIEVPPPVLPPETFPKREPLPAPRFGFSPPPKPVAEMTEAEKKQEKLRLLEEVRAVRERMKQRRSRAALEAARNAVAP
jgi:hypothetical protein